MHEAKLHEARAAEPEWKAQVEPVWIAGPE